MKFLKPLNQKGFGHVELVLAILFIGLFAFVGVRVMGINHAATLTASQCSLLGRTFTASSGVCNKVCASGQGSYVVTSTYDYCSGAVTAASKISASTCATYGRKALISSSVYVGCARRADQKTTPKAPQCANTANTYYVQSTYDKCAAPAAKYTASCTATTPSSVKTPANITVTITCKNISNSVAYVYAYSTYKYYTSGVEIGDIPVGQSKSGTISLPTNTTSTGGVIVPVGTYTVSGKYQISNGTQVAAPTTSTIIIN